MTGPERWRRVEELYHAALERSRDEQDRFLTEACEGDPALLDEVRSLLGYEGPAGSCLGDSPAAASMALEPGTELGAYEVLGLLGAGGMGEVYRARDRKLARQVALKVLPAVFASSPQGLRRFEREARLIAALNHPHIAVIHGLEEASGTRFLVLELVEGETLHERLSRGRIPVREALDLARQVAEAVEAAHERGVVHRDLKPANIKVTDDGRVKVLDFGLAKALADPSADELSETASAVATATTRDGAVMGTPRYMSPEQVGGERLDARTDVWSFGVLLFELLTSAHLFQGTTATEVLAAVLRDDPDWRRLPAETPEAVRRLLRRCLTRERRKRLQAIGEARILLEECLAGRSAALPRLPGERSGRWLAWAAAAALAGLGLIWLGLRTGEPSVPRLSHPVQVSAAIGVEDYPTWSPDGRTLAFESEETGRWDIWVAQVDGGAAADRTAGDAADHRFPSWSPDGSQIAFLSLRGDEGSYDVVPALGGALRRVVAVPSTRSGLGYYRGAPSWSPDGRELACLVYSKKDDELEAFIAIADVVTLDTRRITLPPSGDSRRDLDWSADGRFFAFTACPTGDPETSQLWVLRASDGVAAPLTDGRTWVKSPRWAPDGRHLDFVSNRGGTSDLWRQRMNGMRPVGEPVPITSALQLRQARFSLDGSKLAISRGRWVSNVWRVPLLEDRAATWEDAEQVTFDEAFIEFADVSPDGRRIAFSSDRSGNQDLWVQPIGSVGGELTRLTTDATPEWCPRWSRDGSRIAFYSLRSGTRQIWVMPADGGAATRVTRADRAHDVTPTWSPDGRELAYWSDRNGSNQIWVSRLDGGPDRQITKDAADHLVPSWSPDGRWLAFHANHGGSTRIWQIPAEGGEAEKLSSRPGFWPAWSRDGTRVYFLSLDPSGEPEDLWDLSIGDRTERPLTELRGRRGKLGATTPTTDGRFLYFTWRTDASDVWVVDAGAG